METSKCSPKIYLLFNKASLLGNPNTIPLAQWGFTCFTIALFSIVLCCDNKNHYWNEVELSHFAGRFSCFKTRMIYELNNKLNDSRWIVSAVKSFFFSPCKTVIWCLLISASQRHAILLQRWPDCAQPLRGPSTLLRHINTEWNQKTGRQHPMSWITPCLMLIWTKWTADGERKQPETPRTDQKWAVRLLAQVLLGEKEWSNAWKLAACRRRHAKSSYLNRTETDK